MLRDLLSHPLTRGLDLDDPRTTFVRRAVLQEKVFLRRIYDEWYRWLAAALPDGPGRVLELGSGPGFLSRTVPGLIASETFLIPGVSAVLDGRELPFRPASLRGVVMTNVLHHIPEPRRLFASAGRCVRQGGVVAMVEPWVSPWAGVAMRFHSEPYDPEAPDWELPSGGPLTGANNALPWILFHRDVGRFREEFPGWTIETVTPFLPFRYLASGGIGLRLSFPAASFGLLGAMETLVEPLMPRLAMFAKVLLRRNATPLRT